MRLESRVADLEKTANVADSGECQCPTVPGVSGWRFVTEYESPDKGTPEELKRVRARSDLVERCRVCGRVRNVVRMVYVDDWRSTTRGMDELAEP